MNEHLRPEAVWKKLEQEAQCRTAHVCACVYYTDSIIIGVYVDDLIFASATGELYFDFSKSIGQAFKTKNLGEIYYPFGGWVVRYPPGKSNS